MSCLTMSPSSGSRSVNVAGEVVGWCFAWCAGRRRRGCHRSVCVDVTDLRKQLVPKERRPRQPGERRRNLVVLSQRCRSRHRWNTDPSVHAGFRGEASSQAENAGSIPVIRSKHLLGEGV